ncbi:hypothetical protein LX32DRAFT_136832 [Colletotrichum zoysiae]|uniref:Uncharacterized protein n=1 Tax=Colletotrichum zoysiae TaxID=1216348 RepID=A0AAD9LVF0_9PEZI|nr:hypothetical protein LX32DRAFT_136832 [Colletotrichum zoysiae]
MAYSSFFSPPLSAHTGRSTGCRSITVVVVVFCDPPSARSHHPITPCPLDHSVRSPFLVGRGPAVDEAMACHRTNRGLGCLILFRKGRRDGVREGSWRKRRREKKSIKGHMLSGLISVDFFFLSHHNSQGFFYLNSFLQLSSFEKNETKQATSLHTLVSCRHLPSSHLNLVIPCLLRTSCPCSHRTHIHTPIYRPYFSPA